MRTFRAIGFALGVGLLAGCQGVTPASVSAGVSGVCGDVARLPVSVGATLDAQDPHSTLGVLWADTKAGCAVGAPAAGVSPDWTAMVWGSVKALAPVVLPYLIGLL